MRLTNRGEYPADWPAIAQAVRVAAGNRCIRCGHPAGDSSAKDGLRMPCDDLCMHKGVDKPRVLTVHHLDGDKANCRWWNLLALCQVCHLTIQGKLIPERPYLWAHSPWFVPYVCGFYAHFHGGVDISREEAAADPDRYLAIGQPWRYEPVRQ